MLVLALHVSLIHDTQLMPMQINFSIQSALHGVGCTVLLARLPCLLVHAYVNSLASFYTVGPRAVYSFHVVRAACKPFNQL